MSHSSNTVLNKLPLTMEAEVAKTKRVSAKAPAKLILSGEHAVVYGYPSIAIAIDLYATSTVTKNKQNLLGFDLANLKYNAKHTFNGLSKLRHKAFSDYQRFLHGECSIREVVNKPFELLQLAVSHFFDKLNIVLPGGIDIKTNSSIPTGCGLGSSSATIMSLLYAVGSLLDLELTTSRYIELGKAAENLQHGKSSGIDIHLAVNGGCVKFEDGSFKKLNNLNIQTSNMFLVNTGRPAVSTGECVSQVKKHFKNSNSLGKDFSDLTISLEQQLISNNMSEIMTTIKQNHKLLDYIGVVPEMISKFINDVESVGASAKVCGAGAVSGSNAGAVLVVAPSNSSIVNLDTLTRKYGYTMQAINIDYNGINVA